MTTPEFKIYMNKHHPSFREHLPAIGKKIGYSELAMHVRLAGKPVDAVFVDDSQHYAYGIVGDKIIDGSWHEYNDDWCCFA